MANSDNIKNDAALVDVSQIKAINKVSFKQRMKAYKRKPLSLVLLILVGFAAALSAAALIFIIVYVLVRGVPNLTPELFSLEYNSDNVSCMPSIINTIVLTLVTLIISVPFGVGAAIYLAEYAKRGNKLVKVIRTMAETLAGIPSIVYGQGAKSVRNAVRNLNLIACNEYNCHCFAQRSAYAENNSCKNA